MQVVLDVAGLLPGVGEVADLANAGISVLRGNYIDAGLSLGSMIPFAGWFSTLGKWGKRLAKHGDELSGISKWSDEIGLPGKRGMRIAFSEMTTEEAMKIAKEYRTKAPIKIPEYATMKPVTKNGYDQISYNWSDGKHTYVVRWHTATPNAPTGTPPNWRVDRIIPGSPGGRNPITGEKVQGWAARTEVMISPPGGTPFYIPKKVWVEATEAYGKGIATEEQRILLNWGHIITD